MTPTERFRLRSTTTRTRRCALCREPFESVRSQAIYCSQRCRDEIRAERARRVRREAAWFPFNPQATTGEVAS